MLEELLKEIQTRVEKENRSPMELYMSVLMTGTNVFKSQSLSRDQLIILCSSLLTLFIKQNEATNG